MAEAASKDADDDTRTQENRKSQLVQVFSDRQAETFTRHATRQRETAEHHRAELVGLNAAVANLGAEVARLEVEARNPQPDPEAQQAYDIEFESVQVASRRVEELRAGLAPPSSRYFSPKLTR